MFYRLKMVNRGLVLRNPVYFPWQNWLLVNLKEDNSGFSLNYQPRLTDMSLHDILILSHCCDSPAFSLSSHTEFTATTDNANISHSSGSLFL